jgi:predicted membrane chloride channel (bestrophin family)
VTVYSSSFSRLFPYVYGARWRWSTIPLVILAGFAWLGIDSAAEECESPFNEESVNALNMDSYCIGLMATTIQEIQDCADLQMERMAKSTAA